MRTPSLRMIVAGGAAAALAVTLSSCEPDLGAPISLIQGPRILAVRGNPPEAKEGTAVSYDLMVVDPDGTSAAPAALWAVCQKPRPPSESNAVSGACLDIPDDAGPAPAFQAPVTAANPDDPTTTGACSIFGPLRPPLDPNARPRDPDVTGGFFQPVRVTVAAAAGVAPMRAFALERIQCRLSNAPIDLANQFNNPYDPTTNPNGYTPNRNPSLGSLTVAVQTGAGPGVPSVLSPLVSGAPAAAPPLVAPGQRVTLEASWDADVAETFPVYDLQAVALTPHREALRVSWFATAGRFDHDVTGRAEDDPALSTANDWTAPPAAGVTTVHLWLVLRDSRGGVDFAEFALEVSP